MSENTVKTYGTGTRVMCDHHFGGKPRGVVVAVLEPGSGRSCAEGRIQVRLTETVGPWKQGEFRELPAWLAVPLAQLRRPAHGEYFLRVRTNYRWA
jgi:hypothetical protein